MDEHHQPDPSAHGAAVTDVRSESTAGVRSDLSSLASARAPASAGCGCEARHSAVEPGRLDVAPTPALLPRRHLTALQRSETTAPPCAARCGDCADCVAASDLERDASDEIASALRQIARGGQGYPFAHLLDELDDAVIALRRSLGVPRDWLPEDCGVDASTRAEIDCRPAPRVRS